MVKISSFANFGTYIGKSGLHFTTEIFKSFGFDKNVTFTKPVSELLTMDATTYLEILAYQQDKTIESPEEFSPSIFKNKLISHRLTPEAADLSFENINQISVNWNRGASTGSITIRAISKFGCLGEPFTYNVTLVASPPKPVVKNIDTVCENSSAIYSTPVTTGFTYKWFVTNGSIFGSSTGNSVNIVWGAPGKANAYLVQFNQNGCPSDTAVVDVWISKPAIPSIIGKQSICPNAKGLVYTVTTASIGSSFNWFVSGGSIVGSTSSKSITINWGNPGVGFVKVIETNRFGCSSDTGYYPVDKSYNLNAEFIQGDTDVCEFTKAQLFTVIFAPNTTYNWTVTGGTLVSGQGTDRKSVV